MQLTINISNKDLFDKVLWLLNSLKKDGLEIITPIQKIGTNYFTKEDSTPNSITHIKALRGVGKELYHDIDSDAYMRELRDEW